MAARKLVASAPVLPSAPARSNAVPWSTEVRMMGRPRVMFTVSPKEVCLMAGSPWSWYIASTASRDWRRVGVNAVSAGMGPMMAAWGPMRVRSASRAGAITSISSRPR